MSDSGKYQQTRETEERIQTLRAEIADLKKRWPAHSVPPAMFMRLEELEEELEEALRQRG